MADTEGFEPSVGYNPTLVFQTSPIGRSGTYPFYIALLIEVLSNQLTHSVCTRFS